MRADVRTRFYAKVDRNGPVPAHRPELGPCHVWIGYRCRKGYGQFGFRGKLEKAHRVAFYFAHGRWPEPCGLHRCDNRGCVNDAHLFEGTNAENVADREAKSRRAPPTGESNGRARLTEQHVRDIRAEYARGGVNQQELASRYGVHETNISAIVRRKSWSHVVR